MIIFQYVSYKQASLFNNYFILWWSRTQFQALVHTKLLNCPSFLNYAYCLGDKLISKATNAR